MTSRNRNFDLIIYGADGLVGKLVCEYINSRYATYVRWAIAGKDRSSLEDVKKKLKLRENVSVFATPVDDKQALRTMVSQAKVLVSVVSPYSTVGIPIVEACVSSGTDYCDITGEPVFIRKVIDQFDNPARSIGMRIVNCCGFDSIPADLGVQFLVDEMKKRDMIPIQATMLIEEAKGTISPGTINSMISLFENASFREIFGMANPYYLNPLDQYSHQPMLPFQDAKTFTYASDRFLGGYDYLNKTWAIPYIMQIVDTRIVNRSNALQEFNYGRRFKFNEKTKVTSYFLSLLMSFALAMFHMFMLTPWTRYFLKMILPRVFRGPTQELLDEGYFKAVITGKGKETQTGRDKILKCCIEAHQGDPAYRQTAKMLSECAMCLIQDRDQLPKINGVLTPSVAFGNVLRGRLESAGIKFSLMN